MSKSSLVTFVVVVSSLIGARAKAQTALQQLKAQAGEAAVAAAVQAPVAGHAVAAQALPPALAPRATDVFARCQVFTAKAFSEVQWTLPQAAQVTQFCLNKSFQDSPDYSVTASASQTGITITVAGQVLAGDPVLADLGYSLSRRGGKLLGYGAALQSRVDVLK